MVIFAISLRLETYQNKDNLKKDLTMQGIATHLQSFTKRSLYTLAAIAAVTVFITIFSAQSTHAATRTWTGAAGDYQIGTAGNWSGGVAPTTGDILHFSSWVGTPNGNSSNNINLTNNLANTVFGGVTVADTAENGNYYSFDTFRISSGSTIQTGEGLSLAFDHLIATGTVTLDGPVVDDLVAVNVNIKGAFINKAQAAEFTIESGAYLTGTILPDGTYSFAGVDLVKVQKGASFGLCGSTGFATIATDFILGGGTGENPVISLSPCMGDGVSKPVSAGAEFTGDITLLSDAKIRAFNQTLVVKGTLVSNGHDLLIDSGSMSRIKGTGTVGTVALESGGTIAPGLSPGILTTGNLSFVSGSTYDFEVGGLTAGTEYDQIKVVGTVNLGSGTLNAMLYNGFVPAVGQSYVIIDNDGSDAVVGTFAGLAEGNTVTVDGHHFKVSYVGGDGNDVTLTIVSVPNAPNTGAFELPLKNPIVILAFGVFSALALVVLAKTQKAKATSRR